MALFAPQSYGKVFVGIVVVFFLLGIFLFFFKVFSYYRQIQAKGLGVPDGLSFSATTIPADALEALAKGQPGEGAEVATADDPALGSPSASLTIVEFADFGCPYSLEERPIVRAMAKKFPQLVRIIYRDFPLDAIHPGASLAAQGGTCASAQGKFWEYHDAMFAIAPGEDGFSFEDVTAAAENAGVSMRLFSTCMDDPATREEVEEDAAAGYAVGVRGTPTFFFNGAKIEGAIPYAVFVELISAFAP